MSRDFFEIGSSLRSQCPSIMVIVGHKESVTITSESIAKISYLLQLSGLLMVLHLIKLAEGEEPHIPHEI
jgi:hypothetical protein